MPVPRVVRVIALEDLLGIEELMVVSKPVVAGDCLLRVDTGHTLPAGSVKPVVLRIRRSHIGCMDPAPPAPDRIDWDRHRDHFRSLDRRGIPDSDIVRRYLPVAPFVDSRRKWDRWDSLPEFAHRSPPANNPDWSCKDRWGTRLDFAHRLRLADSRSWDCCKDRRRNTPRN